MIFPIDKALMVNNADWLMDLNYIEVLREVGAHFLCKQYADAQNATSSVWKRA